MVDIQTMLDAITAATTLDQLQALLPDLCRSLGVSHIVYHAINIPSTADASKPVFVLTYGDDWLNRFFAERYFDIDPILHYGRRARLHLDWSDVVIPAGRTTDFFLDAERHGVGRHGITIPIRGPFGERALFTVNSRSSPRDWELARARLVPHLHTLGHFMHEQAMQLSAVRRETIPSLSRREMECLQRAASGKQYKEIAWDLGLSTNAVELYLKNARQKLDATTLAQAVAAALALEFIEHGSRPLP